MSQGEESRQHNLPESPVRTQSPRHTTKNRKVVLVGETFIGSKQQPSPLRSSTGSIPRVSFETPVSQHRASIAQTPNTHGTPHLGLSPVSSPRSSVSSIVDLSTMSSLVMTPSSEDHILDELREQIASSAERIHQLETMTKQIPVLQDQVDKLQIERGKLANNLQDQQEVAKNLKQRVAMLHEQNSQLGKLLKSQQGGSGEVIAMRNTIMASLAQLKQLQEQVNTIPGFKRHINMLEQERQKFSEDATSSCIGGGSQSLLEENGRLKASNAELVDKLKVVREQLTSVSQSCDGLKQRIEAFENAQSRSTMLRERVKRLEAEKDALHHEIIDLKFHNRRSKDVDSAELSKQMITLQKANVQLRKKMELIQHDARQQKEQLVLKLFEIEALNVTTHKYELEKRVLEMEQLQVQSETHPILHSANSSLEPQGESSSNVDGGLNPESKIQMLKLEQLRIHSMQSRNVMQAVVAERDDLEKTVGELSALVKEKGIEELMQKVSTLEAQLSLSTRKNEQLEREFEAVLKSGSSMPSAAVEMERLNVELEKLGVECSTLAESNRRLEKKYMHQKEVAEGLELIKEEKRNVERKYKENKDKLRALAKELAGSVTLLKDYQSQCSSLGNELQQMKVELSTLRQKYAATVTELEMAKAEKRSGESGRDISALLSVATATSGSEQPSVPNEEAIAKEKAEQELKELSARNESLAREIKHLHTALEKVSESLSEATAKNLELKAKVVSSKDAQALVDENSRLTTSTREKEEEIASKHEEILGLRNKIESLEEQCRESELELNTVRQQLTALRHEHQSLSDNLELATIQREEKVGQLKQELEDKSKELDTISARMCSEADAKSSIEKKVVEQERRIEELNIEMERHKKLHTEVSAHYKESLNAKNVLQKQMDILSMEKSDIELQKQDIEQKCLEVEQRAHSAKATIGDLEEEIITLKQDLKKTQDNLRIQRKELENMQSRNQTLNNEVEGYQAMVSNLTRQIDQAETRELDHEVLRQKIHRLEAAVSDSSSQQLKVDNRALFRMLQEAVNELPSSAASESGQSLREENLRLEQQVSVLSQWNDKQRQEIENLESRLDELLIEKEGMAIELARREGNENEIIQLRRELLETEQEVNALRRQVRADLQEEIQVKVETQSQMLSVFSEHNQRLQQQVEELQQQVRSLGGELTREKAVSPPPFPDPTNTATLMEGSRTLSEVTRESEILSQRYSFVEEQLNQLTNLSVNARRCSSSLRAVTSIPVAPIRDDVQMRYVGFPTMYM